MDFAPLTPAQADSIYTILVESGAEIEFEYSREAFVEAQTAAFESEYRFMGALGFGGKFRRGNQDRWYVDCYRENLNKRTASLVEAANAALESYQATQV